MNRSQLVDAVADRTGTHKDDAAKAVDAVIDTIKDTVAAGEKVVIIGFGTFERAERAARETRNMHTGDRITIPATRVPKFKAGGAFKDKVKAADEAAHAAR
jgi:DNA-binding protein HU-beta